MTAIPSTIEGTYHKLEIGNDCQVRLILVADSYKTELSMFLSAIFEDGLETLLEIDWDTLRKQPAPVTLRTGQRELTLDAGAIDAIDSAGWRLLMVQGHGPTQWVEHY